MIDPEKKMRFGLICIFREEPIKFRRTTAKFLKTLNHASRLDLLGEICLANSEALIKSLEFCRDHEIGAFRINSQILPLKTHPEMKYDLTDLPTGKQTLENFENVGIFSRKHDIRTSFHPDQFVLLSSPDPLVTERSIEELMYQSELAETVNADVINIHGGGGYGDKESTLKRLMNRIESLPDQIKSRLTLENDDYTYTPQDLLPVCQKTGVPFVYDVHHHRCLSDGMTVEEVTELALETWDGEALFHLSSPKSGWESGNCRPHNDFINVSDFPECWKDLKITVDVEAKAKELAVIKLMEDLARGMN